MSNRQGTAIWYELMTENPDTAQAFYATILGWTFDKPYTGANKNYRTFTSTDGDAVGGILQSPDGVTFGPTWLFYIGVDDVDAAAKQVTTLGGRVDMEPTDIPDVGRFALVADPQGAQFYLMRGNSDKNSPSFSQSQSGHCSWNELVTSDQNAAMEFYSAMFGWEKSGAMPMGDSGDYTFLSNGDTAIGAMMNVPETEQAALPYWNFAFNVDDIDAAVKAVVAGGGTVRLGPLELPDDSSGWLIQITDSQGAKVMFTGPRKG